MKCSSRVTSATRRCVTTTCLASAWRHFSQAKWLAGPEGTAYRFLFIPGTIGAITWLARNQDRASRIQHGLVLTCVGDPGGFHYKTSRQGRCRDRSSRRARPSSRRRQPRGARLLALWIRRAPVLLARLQPGRRLPDAQRVGSVSEYHTSADNLDLVTACCARRNASDVHEHRRGARAQPDVREHESLLRAGSGETWAVSNRWRERRQRQYGAPVGPQPVGRRTLTARHRRTLGAGFCNGTCRGY